MNTTKQIVAAGSVAVAALIGTPLANAQPQPPPTCDVEAVPAEGEVQCAPIVHDPDSPAPPSVAREDQGPGSGGLGDSPTESP